MTTLREAAQMALDALELVDGYVMGKHEAKEALYEALAQPEQEPPCKTGSQCVGGKCERCAVQEPWGYISHRSWKMPVFVEAGDLEVSGLPFNNPDYTPVYKAPPQREFIGLTDKEHEQIAIDCGCASADWVFYGAAVERKVKEKNT